MENKLLKKIKSVKTKNMTTNTITREKYEVGLAWAKGEITALQVQKGLGYPSPSSTYSFLARCFKYHIEHISTQKDN